MYLVVIAVLSVILTFSRAPYPWVTQTAWTLAAVGAATLIPPAFARLLNRLVLRRFERHPENPGKAQAIFGRGMSLTQALLALGHIATYLFTDWLHLCHQMVGVWFVLPGLLALAPFLIALILAWLAIYPADRAVRQLAVEIFLFRGKPLRPVWSIAQYIAYNLRHQVLFILIPMLLILAARDVIIRYEQPIRAFTELDYTGDLLLGLSAVLVAVVAPEILRHVWVTQRLPDGPLRDRLLLLCRQLKLRCREILVWRSGGMIVNAAVMGVIAPLRYVLITDAMLEQLDDRRIEAVFGHEAGHVKRHHILFFLLFALISGCIVTIFSVRARGISREDYEIAAAILGGILLFKWGVLFGWLSRRFERQADVFSVRTLGAIHIPCAQPCLVHNPPPDVPTPPGDRLCATAAHVFSDALNEVALLNGIRPDARSWRHSSISSRSRFVQRLARDPVHTRRFEQQVLIAKIVILLLAATFSVWAATEVKLWGFVLRWF